MAYTVPTPAEFKARYPAFASVGDPVAQGAIDDAALEVDENWVEADYAPAIMALAAHFLVTEGALDPAGSPSSATTGSLRSKSMGDSSESYDTKAGEKYLGTDADLATTTYGIRFMRIRARNVVGFMVI